MLVIFTQVCHSGRSDSAVTRMVKRIRSVILQGSPRETGFLLRRFNRIPYPRKLTPNSVHAEHTIRAFRSISLIVVDISPNPGIGYGRYFRFNLNC